MNVLLFTDCYFGFFNLFILQVVYIYLFEFDTIGVYRGVDGDMDEIIPC